MSRRPTIADIAEAAGVSKGAVSYALNGRPGVSKATREKILAIATEMGFVPNRAARSLSVASAQAVGIALRRSARTLGIEPFFMELISGIEVALSAESYGLTLQIVGSLEEELEVYRRWWAERRVDGVLLCDLRIRDERMPELTGMGMPTVAIGGPLEREGVSAVWHDEVEPVVELLRYLHALGHRRLVRVAGLSGLLHTATRNGAFAEVPDLDFEKVTIYPSDYTGEEAARLTRKVLTTRPRPTAILYDNDIMAVAGLGVAHELGLDVPGELSMVSWEDTPLCRLTHPSLTAFSRDIPGYGKRAAEMLLSLMGEAEGAPVRSEQIPSARLIPRGSTGPASH